MLFQDDFNWNWLWSFRCSILSGRKSVSNWICIEGTHHHHHHRYYLMFCFNYNIRFTCSNVSIENRKNNCDSTLPYDFIFTYSSFDMKNSKWQWPHFLHLINFLILIWRLLKTLEQQLHFAAKMALYLLWKNSSRQNFMRKEQIKGYLQLIDMLE